MPDDYPIRKYRISIPGHGKALVMDERGIRLLQLELAMMLASAGKSDCRNGFRVAEGVMANDDFGRYGGSYDIVESK